MSSPAYAARWWHPLEDGRIQCDTCPRGCRLRDGQRGYCFVRANTGGRLDLTTYGRSSGFALDPIEKKPLTHFLPGTTVLSFGTAGCNLGCQFCQNHEISTSRQWDTLAQVASPTEIARTAIGLGAASVAFTYNDPTIFAEYAIDTAAACRELGLRAVAVSAGYICPEPRAELYAAMDAANIDLKGFTHEFYRHITGADLDVVKETLRYVAHETSCWLEVTTLLIPGLNDSDAEVAALSAWVAAELGPEVPLHFSAFHPDNRMLDRPPTPPATVRRARARALAEGLRHVYTGNIVDDEGGMTHCGACGETVLERRGYDVTANRLREGACPRCGTALSGVFR